MWVVQPSNSAAHASGVQWRVQPLRRILARIVELRAAVVVDVRAAEWISGAGGRLVMMAMMMMVNCTRNPPTPWAPANRAGIPGVAGRLGVWAYQPNQLIFGRGWFLFRA
jgi:hypothetical protein